MEIKNLHFYGGQNKKNLGDPSSLKKTKLHKKAASCLAETKTNFKPAKI